MNSLHTALLTLATALAAIPAAQSQVSSTSPQFEAVSMKLVASPAPPGAMGKGTAGGSAPVRRIEKGRVDLESIAVKELVLKAYGVPDMQVVWPEWVSDPRKAGFPIPFYTVRAVMPPETTDKQLQLMFQNLLKERLKLVAHREQRDLTTYDITVASGGLRMREVKLETQYPTFRTYRGEDGWWAKGEMGIQALAASLNHWLPVVDKTGLTGYYDVDIRWDWPATRIEDHMRIDNKPSEAQLRTLFATMEKNLGLKVERHTAKVEFIVIDHLEHIPTED